jgi:hypothetical protein
LVIQFIVVCTDEAEHLLDRVRNPLQSGD